MAVDLTKSVRFFPNWNQSETNQVIGFLEFVHTILADAGMTTFRWVEVGSYFGESATMILGFPNLTKLTCVEQSAVHVAILREKFAGDIEAGRCEVIHAASLTVAAATPPGSIDIVYIDADHKYDSVKADIQAWLPAIRKGGYISGHDYCAPWPGVMQAVDEAIGGPERLFRDGSWAKEIR